MDIASLLSIAAAITFLGATLYSANLDEMEQQPFKRSRWLLYAACGVTFLFALFILQAWLLSRAELDSAVQRELGVPRIETPAAFAGILLCLGGAGLGFWVITQRQARLFVQRLTGSGTFNPDSTVHAAAVVLSLAIVCTNLAQLILSGGISGIAENVEPGTNFIGSALFQQILWIVAGLLGVGLFLRRSPSQAAERLGLRVPLADDIFGGLSVGGIMLAFIFVLAAIWAGSVSPETFAEQTAASSQITNALNTLPAALLISLAVALGEELFFRGAMQPVFGLGLTSLFFVLLHTQYTLTPASLGILVLSFALGWLRQRQSTTAAIIAHFVYNFIQLALAIFASNLMGGMN
ncbi:MAG: type II CAAX endopeptidase family protein [bacterium]|nr:type II CAAX endopeptidase family protein [bacterium]